MMRRISNYIERGIIEALHAKVLRLELLRVKGHSRSLDSWCSTLLMWQAGALDHGTRCHARWRISASAHHDPAI